MMVRQNKWRAARLCTRAQLINSYTYDVQSISQIMQMMIGRLSATAESLGCISFLQRNQAIADGPSWADRQQEILDKTGDRGEIVRQLSAESRISAH